jgi:hypothetical protein
LSGKLPPTGPVGSLRIPSQQSNGGKAMIEKYRSIINWLRAAIKNEDVVTVIEIAKQLLPLRDQIRIEADPPVVYYRDDHASRSQCTAMSIHRLIIGEKTVGEWTRQSIGGMGLDLNHPNTWAAVAINPVLSRYEIVIKPMLEVFGLEDLAPSIPNPE